MKKIIVLLFIGLTPILYSQKLKIELSAGYGNGLASISTVSYTDTYNDVENSYKAKEVFVPIRFNTGFVGRLGLSYMLNNELFVSTSVRYQSSSTDFIQYEEINVFPDQYYRESESYKIDYNSTDIQIGLGLHLPLAPKLSLSMSAGPSFVLQNKLIIETLSTVEYQSAGISNNYEGIYTQEFTPQFSIGAYGDVSLNFAVTKRIELFGNTTLRMKSWSPKQSKITKYSENGINEMESLTTSEIETIYMDEIINDFSGPSNPDEPSKSTRDWAPSAGVEYTLGVRYNFGAISELESVPGKKGLYFEVNGGYGIPMSGMTHRSSAYDGSTSEYSVEQYSYGSGINLGGLMGYGLKNGVSFELGAMYNKSKQEYSWKSINATYYTNEASMIRSMLGIKVEGTKPKFNPFFRFGLLTGLSAKLTESSESSNWVITTSERSSEYKGNLSFGGYTGLGASLHLTNTISLVGEVQALIQNWSPEKRTRTKSIYNGEDQLQFEDYSYINTVFVDEIAYDENSEYDPNKASESIRFSAPFSALTFKLGLRIDLRK